MIGAALEQRIAESLDAAIRGLDRIWLDTSRGSLLSEAQRNFWACRKGEAGFTPDYTCQYTLTS
jgi:hypothetical protein